MSVLGKRSLPKDCVDAPVETKKLKKYVCVDAAVKTKKLKKLNKAGSVPVKTNKLKKLKTDVPVNSISVSSFENSIDKQWGWSVRPLTLRLYKEISSTKVITLKVIDITGQLLIIKLWKNNDLHMKIYNNIEEKKMFTIVCFKGMEGNVISPTNFTKIKAAVEYDDIFPLKPTLKLSKIKDIIEENGKNYMKVRAIVAEVVSSNPNMQRVKLIDETGDIWATIWCSEPTLKVSDVVSGECTVGRVKAGNWSQLQFDDIEIVDSKLVETLLEWWKTANYQQNYVVYTGKIVNLEENNYRAVKDSYTKVKDNEVLENEDYIERKVLNIAFCTNTNAELLNLKMFDKLSNQFIPQMNEIGIEHITNQNIEVTVQKKDNIVTKFKFL